MAKITKKRGRSSITMMETVAMRKSLRTRMQISLMPKMKMMMKVQLRKKRWIKPLLVKALKLPREKLLAAKRRKT